jgi:hypothetical protein
VRPLRGSEKALHRSQTNIFSSQKREIVVGSVQMKEIDGEQKLKSMMLFISTKVEIFQLIFEELCMISKFLLINEIVKLN